MVPFLFSFSCFSKCKNKSPFTSFVKENVTMLFCCDAPEMFCGLQECT